VQGGDDNNSDSGSRKGKKGDEGGPVCPRCKEPFADSLSAISKSCVHSDLCGCTKYCIWQLPPDS
jgi:hypothetical protein